MGPLEMFFAAGLDTCHDTGGSGKAYSRARPRGHLRQMVSSGCGSFMRIRRRAKRCVFLILRPDLVQDYCFGDRPNARRTWCGSPQSRDYRERR